jgi:NADH:ubiquinone oxidoreductase subunit 6 (subunit J)
MLTGFSGVYAKEIGGQRRAMALDVAFTLIGGIGAVLVLIRLVRATLRARLRDDPFRFIYLWLLLVVCLILLIWGIVLGQPLNDSPPTPNPFIGGTPALP